MLELARLQFRRESVLAAAMAASVLVSLPIAFWVSRGDVVPSAVQATVLFWVVLGLPGFALLLGSSTGAELASAPSRSAELLLPVSPSRRAWGGLAGAAIHMVWLGALVLLVAWAAPRGGPLDDFWRVALPYEFSWKNNEFAFTLTFLGSIPYFLLASLLGAYLFRHGVLGGLIGGVLAGWMLFWLAIGLSVQAFNPDRAHFLPAALACLAAGWLGCGWTLHRLAPWAERKARLAPARLACLAALAALGAAGSTAAALRQGRQLGATTRIVLEDGWPRPFRSSERSPAGVMLMSMDGDVLWVTSDGKRRALLGAPSQWQVFPDWKHMSYLVDDEGRHWLLVAEEYLDDQRSWQYAVWTWTPEGEPTLRSRFSGWYPSLARRGKEVVLRSYGEGFSPLPAQGRQPVWDGRPVDERTHYTDGRGLNPIPAGGGWGFDGEGDAVRLARSDSEHPRRLLLKGARDLRAGRVAALRYDGTRLWLLAEHRLLEFDARSGLLLKETALAAYPRAEHWRHDLSLLYQVAVAEGGFFRHIGAELQFVTWDGQARSLGQ